jgi:hypothetical protein
MGILFRHTMFDRIMAGAGVRFFDKQEEIIASVDDNDETFVVAANQVGKDFTAAYIVLRYFLSHGHERGGCRIITTSVKDDHLRVLWGELGRFIQVCPVPLDSKQGGHLLINFRDIRYVMPDGTINPISYLRGMVSKLGEGMAGHHAAYTLCAIDEASGVQDIVYDQARTWAKRILVIGNPLPCQNFFYRAVRGGDIPEGQKPPDQQFQEEDD